MKKSVSYMCILLSIFLAGCGKVNKPDNKEVEKDTKETAEVSETAEKTVEDDGIVVEFPPLDMENPIKRRPSSELCKDNFTGRTIIYKFAEDNTNPFQIDLRGADLGKFNLSGSSADLIHADFDTKTIWPDNISEDFNYNEIMEKGKNPGLGIKKLHDSGITGKGASIGIIDQELLVDHIEYKDNLKYYEEIGETYPAAAMHGAAVSSIAVGKNVGVAPDANLYYICAPTGTSTEYDFSYTAAAIDRMLEINEHLDKDERIRVISISVGWNEEQKGYSKVMDAVKRANEKGVLVVSSSISLTNEGYWFDGLDRAPYNDPDELNSYIPGRWFIKDFCEHDGKSWKVSLFVPMGARTTASQSGEEDYAFYSDGGWSWCCPYIAGVYALACQVNPDMTYEEFWKSALETADSVKFSYKEKEYTIPKVLNPAKLIDAIK